jgi:hypothetical protein
LPGRRLLARSYVSRCAVVRCGSWRDEPAAIIFRPQHFQYPTTYLDLGHQNRKLRPAKWGETVMCAAKVLSRPCLSWVKGGGTEDAGRSSAVVSIPDNLLRRRELARSSKSCHRHLRHLIASNAASQRVGRSTCQAMCTMLNVTSDRLDTSRDRHRFNHRSEKLWRKNGRPNGELGIKASSLGKRTHSRQIKRSEFDKPSRAVEAGG